MSFGTAVIIIAGLLAICAFVASLAGVDEVEKGRSEPARPAETPVTEEDRVKALELTTKYIEATLKYDDYVSFKRWLDGHHMQWLKDNPPKEYRIILQKDRWFVQRYDGVSCIGNGYVYDFPPVYRNESYYPDRLKIPLLKLYNDKSLIEAGNSRAIRDVLKYEFHEKYMEYQDITPNYMHVWDVIGIEDGFLYKKEAELYLKNFKHDIVVLETQYDLEEI